MNVWDFVFRNKKDAENMVLDQKFEDCLRKETESTYKMLCELIREEDAKRLDAFLRQSNLLNSLLFLDVFTMGFGCGLRFQEDSLQRQKENEKNT